MYICRRMADAGRLPGWVRKSRQQHITLMKTPESTQTGRLVSLDVFRGITIAAMVLVNNPGSWSAIYWPLSHAEWHGVTPTDYIFPFFLFIVGTAIPFSLGKRTADDLTGTHRKILVRSAAIFGAGIAISALPLFVIGETDIPWPAKWTAASAIIAAFYFVLARNFRAAVVLMAIWAVILAAAFISGYQIVPYHIGTMRIPGVLQRIAVCYLAASVIFLRTNWKQQAAIGAALLLAYWLLMTAIPVPGCNFASIDDKLCNLAAYVDRAILTEAHMWKSSRVFDPEGLLSTIPAIVTTLTGVLTGTWLRSGRSEIEKSGGMFFFGVILLAAGWIWSLIFPFNKSLWTSSYVVYTSGLALLALSSCYWLIDIKGIKRWSKPFVIFGVNALALFVFSGIFARMIAIIKITGAEGSPVSLQQWVYLNIFLPFASPVNASLSFAVSFILFWLFQMWLLYRKGIFIKV